jgi:leucyl-tRNA synthetase
MFGEDFSKIPADDEEVDEAPIAAPTQAVPKTDVTKFKARETYRANVSSLTYNKQNTKRGKAALKGAGARYQYQTMLSMGVPLEEIHKFADSVEWVRYFPQLWRRDMTALGCGIDWRLVPQQ